MIRNRFPRFPQKGRNPQNLHVIPTASVENINVKQLNPAVIQITPTENLNTNNNFFNQNKSTGRYQKRKRKGRRQRKKGDSSNQSVAQNINVNCSNHNDKEPVVSPPQKENEKVENAPDAPAEENYFEEVEVASVEAEPKQETLVRFRKTKPCYMKYRKKGVFKPKFYKIGDPTFVNCMNVQEDVDVDIVSEAEYEYETDNLERSDSQEMLNRIIEIDDSEEIVDEDVEDETSQDTITTSEPSADPSMRIYKTCIEQNGDLTQGKSLIQDSLDSCKSHLIGLEYLIEIQNTIKDSVLKYQCVLCLEDITVQGFPAVYVINHINSYKHIVKYLEKHFPAFGYKFAENNAYNIVDLQKFAEEINQNLGYYFMCISNLEYYVKNFQNIEETINNAYHPNEKDFVHDKNSLQQKIDSDFKEEIKSIISSVIKKVVLQENKLSKGEENKSIPKSIQSDLQTSEPSINPIEVLCIDDDSTDVKAKSNAKKEKRPKSFVYKGNNPLMSYMALSVFAESALKKTKKKKSVTKDTNKKELGGTVCKITQNANSEVTENVSHGAEIDIQDKTAKNVKQETREDVKNEADEIVTHETIENVDQETVQDADQETGEEEDVDQEIVEDVDQEIEEDVEQEIVEDVDQEIVEDADQEIVEDIDQGTGKEVDHDIVEEVVQETGEEAVEVIDLAEDERQESVDNGNIETPESEQHEDNSEAAVPAEIASDMNQKDHKTKGKVLTKTSTVHSKYCRKIIEVVLLAVLTSFCEVNSL